MKLEITLKCEACGFSSKVAVNQYFNCDDLVCPNCQDENCLSIISATDISATEQMPIGFSKQNILKRLQNINML